MLSPLEAAAEAASFKEEVRLMLAKSAAQGGREDGAGKGKARSYDALLAAKSFDMAVGAGLADEVASLATDAKWVEAVVEGSGQLGLDPLLAACRAAGTKGAVVKAFAQGASEMRKLSAAVEAARYGRAAAGIALVGLGVSVDAKTGDGKSLLHLCAADDKGGHLELMAFLLAEGADAGAKEQQFGATPLAWACYSKNPGAVKLLVGKGGLDAMDNRGTTPLGYCSAKNFECAQILLKSGANLHARLPGKACAFERSVEEGAPEAIKIAQWANYETKASNGMSWIDFAKMSRGYVSPHWVRELTQALGKSAALGESKALADHVPKGGSSGCPRNTKSI
jgi:hypothetical protein